MSNPDIEWIKTRLRYDPETGLIRHKRTGKIAGSTTAKGYRQYSLRNRTALGQFVAWVSMTGKLPPRGKVLDHIDRDKLNNQWSNLRLITQAQNCLNHGMYSTNTSGYQGVSQRSSGRFEASIKRHHTKYHLGLFQTAEEASEAFQLAMDMFEAMRWLQESVKMFRQIRIINETGFSLATEKVVS